MRKAGQGLSLSDPKEPSFQATCDHDHSDVCERCATVASTLNDIEDGLVAQSQNMTSNTKEKLVFRVKNAKTAILAWKSHFFRLSIRMVPEYSFRNRLMSRLF